MISYQEGTAFALPLRSGGYATGVVARITPRGGVALVYLFGPARKIPLSQSELVCLRPEDALLVARIGDLSLLDGTWKIIGQFPGWNREEWPMPPFVRREDITKKAWLVRYSDQDANLAEFEEPIDYPKVSEFDRDAVLGAGAAEIVMTKMLKTASG
jgi:hypothetical protein